MASQNDKNGSGYARRIKRKSRQIHQHVPCLPVVFPLIVGLGFDPIWWGVINIMVIEIGQTTPPIGIIPFVLHGMRPDIPLKTIFGGVLPFFAADITRLLIIAAFPILALWLPDLLGMLVY